MKSNYIEIVPVRFNDKGKTYIYQAKGFSSFKKGDIVRVEGNHDHYAKVAADSKSVRKESDDYEWLIDVFGATKPLKKIIGVFRVIEYDE